MWQKEESVGNPTNVQHGGISQTVCAHHGANDVSMESTAEVFGSGYLQPELGVASTPLAMMPMEGITFPTFCGGASSQDDNMGDSAPEDAKIFQEEPQHGDRTSLDFVLQNLQCRLGNPRNRCFANAPFRLWAWAGSFLAGPKMWNLTAAALHAALSDDDVVQITKLPTMKPLWSKFDDSIQDDAAQFLLEMVDLAQPAHVITHHHHVDHRQQVHKRKEFPTHLIFEDRGEPQQFEELISKWANQAEGQILDGRGLWVAQVGRYTLVDNEWTKHHQVLQIPSIFNLPLTLDGQSTKTEQFSLVGLLCHSGTAHKSGHFFAVFVYRGLYWIVDDGSYPRLVLQLQETLKTQIVQVWVWAIPSRLMLPIDIPCGVPMHGPLEPEFEVPPKRRCFAYANVTSLGPHVRQWLLGRERTPIFLAETHLGCQNLPMAEYPWFCCDQPKTDGGFPNNLHFHFIQKQFIDGCGWFAVHWTFENFGLIIMVYFKCGEGLQGATNARLWSGLLTFVTNLATPAIVIGDFNITPEEFMTTSMNTVMQMQVLATGEDTCLTGREIDWALVPNALHPEARIKVDWQVPFKPHGQLTLHLDKRASAHHGETDPTFPTYTET